MCIIGTIFEANVFPPPNQPVKSADFSWFKLLINLIVYAGVSRVQESALFSLLLTNWWREFSPSRTCRFTEEQASVNWDLADYILSSTSNHAAI